MAETLPDITLTATQYVSVNAITGIPIGTCLSIQNKTVHWVYLVESATQPVVTDPADRQGTLLTDIFGEESTKVVLAGSLEIWAICAAKAPREARINVQNIE